VAQTVAPVATSDGPAEAPAPAAPLEPRPRLTGWRFPLAVALASRLLAVAAMAVVALVKWPAGASLGDALLAPLGAWDGEWYARIAEHGYDPTLGHGNAAAFFPLYPSLIGALHDVLPFVNVVVLGAVVSNLAFVAGILLLWRLTRERFGDEMARRVTWYVSFAPVAFVFSTVYTEGLFLLLVVGTFLLLEHRRSGLACVVAALSVLTRPVGIALLPALAWRMWDDNGRRFDRTLALRAVPLLLLPAAYAGFQAYLWWRTGLPGATELAQERGWGRQAEPLLVLALPLALLHGLWQSGAGPRDLQELIDAGVAMLATWLLLHAAYRRLVPTEYLLAAAGALVLPALAGTYLAFPRYGMTVFVLAWLLALHASRRWLDRTLRIALPVSMVVFVVLTYGPGVYTP
jgi:hypothetical protein